jgi:hypothetical protein
MIRAARCDRYQPAELPDAAYAAAGHYLNLSFRLPDRSNKPNSPQCRHPTIIKHPQRINQSFENDSAVTEQRY